MKNKGLIVAVSVLSLIVIVFGSYIAYEKLILPKNSSETNKTSQNENKELEKSVRIDDTKEYIYNAEYDYGVSETSYSTGYDTYKVSDIVVPYINLLSATDDNKEIKSIFDKAITAYKTGLADKTTYVDECNYVKYLNEDIYSVLLTFGIGATDVVHPEYYTYNYDIKTGKKQSYEEIYTLAGLTKNNIESKVSEAITNYLKEELKDLKDPTKDTGDGAYYPDGTNFDTYKNKSLDNYKNSVKDKSIQYFLDKDDKLNIIVKISIPAGIGEFNAIISVN